VQDPLSMEQDANHDSARATDAVRRTEVRGWARIGRRAASLVSGRAGRAWLLTIAWSILIWVANTRPSTISTQSGLLNYIIWQGGHLSAHLILGLIGWHAAMLTWDHAAAFAVTLLGGCLHAGLDEWVQVLVPSRNANLEDVLYNIAGVALGVAIAEAGRLRSERIRT